MSKSTSRIAEPPVTAITSSAVRVHQNEIESLEEKQRAAAMKIIWEYDAANEDDFRFLMQAFVRLVGSKAEAGRQLITPAVTMHRWLNGLQVPRIFLRASFKSRMIELLSEAFSTSPDEINCSPSETTGETLKRRRS